MECGEQRELLFVDNPGLKPNLHSQALKKAIKEIACVRSCNVRISDRRVEVDLVHSCCGGLEKEIVEIVGGRSVEKPQREQAASIVRVLDLIKDGRFWEAHESLEEMLAKYKDNPEVKALLIASAAAAKAQEGFLEAAFRILSRFDWESLSKRGGVSEKCLEDVVRLVWERGYGDLLRCFQIDI